VEVRLIHRAASPEQFAWLEEHSERLSRTAELRAMARKDVEGGGRRLVAGK
jgi:putative ABC transport system permease protein